MTLQIVTSCLPKAVALTSNALCVYPLDYGNSIFACLSSFLSRRDPCNQTDSDMMIEDVLVTHHRQYHTLVSCVRIRRKKRDSKQIHLTFQRSLYGAIITVLSVISRRERFQYVPYPKSQFSTHMSIQIAIAKLWLRSSLVSVATCLMFFIRLTEPRCVTPLKAAIQAPPPKYTR